MDCAAPEEVDAIFSNITDLVELTITLIGSLEDTLEMAEEGQVHGVVVCARYMYGDESK